MRNQIFKSEEFGSIRTICDEHGEVLFCAKDVARALGYKKPENAVSIHVDKEDKTSTLIQGSGSNYKSKTTFINESGLYSLILGSKLESARRFKHWVTSEVLPAIRKDGGYMVTRAEESDEVIMARALLIMQKALEKRDAEIAELKPRAEYADEVLDSVSCMTVTQIGKELGMTGRDLNILLCEMHVQYPQSGQYLLYADYARKGYARNRTHEFRTSGGELITRSYLVWTERGRDFIHQLVKKIA